ncbi:DUF4115 domain-containing protein [Xanthomonadaceae bacterium JHOS43]|nr:DUF4115 domain-containing protein [Xanthomonadaceae bacterium JHOS43]MCX7563490.1 DUF4115 domain-containing protein [Xanthomonadaceae bacterium XH05]
MSSHDTDLFPVPPGLRLRQAREAAGWSSAQVAERLRLRVALVESIEREDLAALGAPVFARGYISGYANLVGLPSTLVDELLPREPEVAVVPPLHTSQNKVSHNRYLLDRYARRFVYVALTASIVVPVVLMSTSDNLPDPATLLTPLDAPLTEASSIDGQATVGERRRVEMVGPPAPAEHAVMASLTPFYSQSRAALPAPVSEVVEQAATQALVLEVSGDSWVEVIGHSGERLAHDLMRDGARRDFDPARVARVLLGNAAVVKVRLNGEEIDTGPFRRANVARFTVSSDGSLAPAGG